MSSTVRIVCRECRRRLGPPVDHQARGDLTAFWDGARHNGAPGSWSRRCDRCGAHPQVNGEKLMAAVYAAGPGGVLEVPL